MSFPNETYVAQIVDPAVRQEFQQLYSLLQGYLSTQHKDDGSHGDVTADSVTTALLAPSAPAAGAGNITGSLIPTTAGAYDLGGPNPASTTHPNLAFRTLYLTNGISLGETSSGGLNPVITTAITDVMSSGVRTTTMQGATSPSAKWNIVGRAGQTLLQLSARAVAGATANDKGIIVPSGALFQVAGGFAADQGLYEHSRTTRLGEWIAVAYASGDYTGTGTIAWAVDSGDVTTSAYTLIGTTLIWTFAIDTTTVSGAGTTLQIALPGGVTAVRETQTTCELLDNGTSTTGYAFIRAGTAILGIRRTDNANWAAATNTTSVRGQIVIEVA